MTRYIHEKLSPRVWAKNEVLLVNNVTAVHDFQQWLDPSGVAHTLVLKRIAISMKLCAAVCFFELFVCSSALLEGFLPLQPVCPRNSLPKEREREKDGRRRD